MNEIGAWLLVLGYLAVSTSIAWKAIAFMSESAGLISKVWGAAAIVFILFFVVFFNDAQEIVVWDQFVVYMACYFALGWWLQRKFFPKQ